MSKQQLAALESKISKTFSDKGKTRRRYNQMYGQVFIFHTRKNKKLLEFALATAGVEEYEKIAKKLIDKIEKLLEKEQYYGKKSYGMRLAKEYRDLIIAGQVPKVKINPLFHKVYAVRNYKAVSEIKTHIGKLIERYTKRYAKQTIDRKSITGAQVKGSIKNTTGVQVGHGEFGAPIALVKTLKIEQAISKFGGSDELKEGLDLIKQKYNIETSISHNMLLSTKGDFKKGWTAILSSQSARANQLDAKEEGAFLAEVENYLAQNLATLEASTNLLDGLTAVTLKNLAKSKSVKVKSNIKPKNVIKTATNVKKKRTDTQNVPRVINGPLVDKVSSPTRAKKSNFSIMSLLPIFNRELPRVVENNMISPRLNYQTGTFAASVRVTDIAITPQGYPSIGYTYDKYPYQTFEPGYAQGSVDRDPRRLIDASIREIAMQFAIGRFYTRRV